MNNVKRIDAAKVEMKSLQEKEAWELVRVRSDRKKVKFKWVFDLKWYKNEITLKHKARSVGKSCSQTTEVDF